MDFNSIDWNALWQAESGSSHGSLALAITEAGGEGLQASLQGGPFEAGATLSAATLSESFTGGPGCGVATGKRKAKAVKKGTFSTSAVEIETG